RPGDRTCRRLAAHQIFVDGEAFERAVQPLGPGRIGVAVRDKGAVFEGDRFDHHLAHCAACAGCPPSRPSAWSGARNPAISPSYQARSPASSTLSGDRALSWAMISRACWYSLAASVTLPCRTKTSATLP